MKCSRYVTVLLALGSCYCAVAADLRPARPYEARVKYTMTKNGMPKLMHSPTLFLTEGQKGKLSTGNDARRIEVTVVPAQVRRPMTHLVQVRIIEGANLKNPKIRELPDVWLQGRSGTINADTMQIEVTIDKAVRQGR